MNPEIEASGHTTPEIDKKRSDSNPSVPEKIEQVDNAGTSLAVDAETEKRLLRKLDMRIIPMICWIYLMNFMDRGMWFMQGVISSHLLTGEVNIGNARLYGLEEDLGMPIDSNQYQLAVGILFVTYCVSGPLSAGL